MNRTPVNSTRVLSIGWADGIMEVEFKGGSIYQYHPVDESTYSDLVSSASVGSDIQLIIRTEGIICNKISPIDPKQNEAAKAPTKEAKPLPFGPPKSFYEPPTDNKKRNPFTDEIA